MQAGSGGRRSLSTRRPTTSTLPELEVPVSSFSLFKRRDPWWESDGPAARHEHRRRRVVETAAFAAGLIACAAAGFAWSIQLGLAASLGIHASLPLG